MFEIQKETEKSRERREGEVGGKEGRKEGRKGRKRLPWTKGHNTAIEGSRTGCFPTYNSCTSLPIVTHTHQGKAGTAEGEDGYGGVHSDSEHKAAELAAQPKMDTYTQAAALDQLPETLELQTRNLKITVSI